MGSTGRSAEAIPADCDGRSSHVAEFPDGQDQADEKNGENGNAPEQEIDGHHRFLASNAASLK